MWQEASSFGTPSLAFTRLIAPVSATSARNPAARRCSTHPSQQPQFGSLNTVICTGADCTAGAEADDSIAIEASASTRHIFLDFMA